MAYTQSVLVLLTILAGSCDIEKPDTGFCNESWYADADGDGYGDAESPSDKCEQPNGYVADSTDCCDSDATVYPGAEDLCDGIDNACDGSIMAGEADADGDGFYSCVGGGDCDDHNAAVNPDATEVNNGIDDDCDGEIDEG